MPKKYSFYFEIYGVEHFFGKPLQSILDLKNEFGNSSREIFFKC